MRIYIIKELYIYIYIYINDLNIMFYVSFTIFYLLKLLLVIRIFKSKSYFSNKYYYFRLFIYFLI